MKAKQPVNIKALSVYLFCVFIAFLAGNYFSSFIFVVFFVLLLYPLVSFAMVIVTYLKIRLNQDFSTEHPVKGEVLKYKLNIANEFFLPFPHLKVSFKSVTPVETSHLPGFSIFVNPKGIFQQEFKISCPYRGIYTVGLEAVVIEDLLHFFSIRLNVWHKTFYVYPRVLELNHFSPGIEMMEGGEKSLTSGGEPDYTMFDKLKEYRPGESVKHIYWKKFGILGKPLLKEYDSSPEPGVKIYFDLRKPEDPYINSLEVEDTSMEILVAMVNHFLQKEIDTSVTASGTSIYEFNGKDISDFKAFYDSTTSLIFQDTASLSDLYQADENPSDKNINSVFFITHVLDVDMFNLIQSIIGTGLQFIVVFNQSGFSPQLRERNVRFFNGLRNMGANIITVDSASSIIDDLERGYR